MTNDPWFNNNLMDYTPHAASAFGLPLRKQQLDEERAADHWPPVLFDQSRRRLCHKCRGGHRSVPMRQQLCRRGGDRRRYATCSSHWPTLRSLLSMCEYDRAACPGLGAAGIRGRSHEEGHGAANRKPRAFAGPPKHRRVPSVVGALQEIEWPGLTPCGWAGCGGGMSLDRYSRLGEIRNVREIYCSPNSMLPTFRVGQVRARICKMGVCRDCQI